MVSVALAQLKQRLQRDYEQAYPGLREIIHLVLDEEEANSPRIMGEWTGRTAPIRAERLRGTEERRAKTEALKRAIADSSNAALEQAKRNSA